MPRRDNIISFGGKAASSRRYSLREDDRPIVMTCRGVVARTLPRLLAGLFEKLDDALYELADKADNNILQTAYFTSMRHIRKERSRIEKEFESNLLSGFDRFWQSGAVRSIKDTQEHDSILASDLALVGDDELEESLAVNNMISKGENRYHRELYALDQRFSFLLSGVEVDNQTNVLAPAAFCNAFRDAIRDLNVDIPVKLVIYKLFDKQVMHYVGGLYDEVNALFGKAGVLPKLTRKTRHNPVAPALNRGDSNREAGLKGDRPSGASAQGRYEGYDQGADDAVQAEIFHLLQQLLSVRRGGLSSAYDTAGVASLPIVDTHELVGALSALQHTDFILNYKTPSEASATLGGLKNQLAEELNLVRDGQTHKAIGQADDDTIDVISMLFEFILEDKNIPDAMKVLIGRLQIPMLKVAIMDKNFFSKKLHPARRLLNNLARAAVGWNDDCDRRKDSFYLTIEKIVSRILAEYEEDPGIFVKLNDELSEYLDKEQRGAEVTEERTTQVTRGKEQLKAAKQLVTNEIESRLSGYQNVPEVVSSLLQEGWKDVLLLSYLRQGPDSESWQDGVALIDTLLWSVEPKAENGERQELLKKIPDLLKSLREGLTGISYDQHKTAHLLKELQACHIACLRGDPSKYGVMGRACESAASLQGLNADAPERTSGIEKSELGLERATGEQERDAYVKVVENLKVGTWLEMEEDGGSKVRAKLSWKSDVSDVYVFVNRRGVKVKETSMDELVTAFRKGSVQRLEEVGVPLMDRALTAMMESLKTSGDEAAVPR